MAIIVTQPTVDEWIESRIPRPVLKTALYAEIAYVASLAVAATMGSEPVNHALDSRVLIGTVWGTGGIALASETYKQARPKIEELQDYYHSLRGRWSKSFGF